MVFRPEIKFHPPGANLPQALRSAHGSHKSAADAQVDWEGIRMAIGPQTKLVTIQRSKGYQTRPTLSVEAIGVLIAFIRTIERALFHIFFLANNITTNWRQSTARIFNQ